MALHSPPPQPGVRKSNDLRESQDPNQPESRRIGSLGGKHGLDQTAVRPVDYFAEISSPACKMILPSMIGLAVSKNAATAAEPLCRSMAAWSANRS